MTRYVIQSGGLSKNPQKARKYFNEIVAGLGKRPKVLMCFFAEKRGHWEKKYQHYKQGFLNNLKQGIEPEFELAMPENFKMQVKGSNLIFIYGGDDQLLMWRLEKFELEELWKGKTVATISAANDLISDYFWTCDWRKPMKGLGILPIKVIPHYQSDYGAVDPRGPIDWKAAHDELMLVGDKSLPIHALKEGDYIVINK